MEIGMKSVKELISKDLRDRYRSQWGTIRLTVKTTYGKLKRQIIRPSFPKLENGELYLHLGCGRINHEKFVNIDGLPAPHIHYI